MANKELKHTPVPYNLRYFNGNLTTAFVCSKNAYICEIIDCGLDIEEMNANAQFIVTACNAYDQTKLDKELLEAIMIKQGEVIKEMVEVVEELIEEAEYAAECCGMSDDE